VLTLDLHAAQIQGFFDIPVDNLYASPVFALDIEHHFKGQMQDLMVISPDVGGVARARNWPSGSTRRWRSSTSGAKRRARSPG
jgi:phosphoribosylpyrophosphate synthetase